MRLDSIKTSEPSGAKVAERVPISLPTIRLYVLERMLWIWSLLGGPIVAVVATDDIAAGRTETAAFYIGSYALVVICLLPRLLPYFWRSAIPLLVLYCVGSYEIFHHGLNSAGNLFYFAMILFTSALLGARVATLVTIAALVSLCGFTYCYTVSLTNGPVYSSFFKFLHLQCLPDVVSLTLLSAMAISFLSYLLKSLESSVETSEEYLAEIARERNQLIQIIEERDKAETQLQQAQKMEAVGQLAGGIAHDFNNLLQVITAHTEILLNQCDSTTPQHENLREVRKASERAASLTRQILAYSRQQVMAPKFLDVNDLLEDLVGMLHRVIPESIETKLLSSDGLGTVHADPVQLEQVLLNLCLNARDAMPDGGTLSIMSENAVVDADFGENHPGVAPGPYVLVRVADTGIGMAGDQQQHIFEPFYTTKSPGEGTGLGLAMAYGIVKQHGGTILARSEVGVGSEFSIFLPSVAHAVTAPEKETPASVPRGSETILVAEDDDAVRTLLIAVLENVGFSVLAASDGEEALALFESNQKVIALLLFDVVMPRLGGREACEAIRATHPEMRVLFMSGYAPEGLSGRFELGDTTGFIQKPYRTQQLLVKIRAVLDA